MVCLTVKDIEAALNTCVTVRDWEMLTESIQIPEVMVPMAFARLTELTAQEIEVSWNILLLIIIIIIIIIILFFLTASLV